ncbi:MAG: hypothetical protein MUC57_07195 [Desulfobacterales bacterium]|jgi:hypothetical protein|nr:hypothetical protein [Desulfobacterales bacterium]
MLTRAANGQCNPSRPLINLLIQARNGYDWPAGTGAVQSQQTILNLEAKVRAYLANLTPASAHAIVEAISLWAGNNANSHDQIVAALPVQQVQMQKAISCLITPGQECIGIDALCTLPGISLVIASKIFRFCSPNQGAAVDRHASYFFNSLQVVGGGAATHFVREWANGRHTTSRLAIYNQSNYAYNKTEYISAYLPILACIAQAMNAGVALYTCAARKIQMNWTPADVEMAAYYWWATNGVR